MADYLVTGGCGFIGSHLADGLAAAGHGVRILDDLSTGRRENAPEAAEIIIGDVADAAVVQGAMAGMDGCFHLAAIASVQRSVEDWAGTHRVNRTGAINVFDAARQGRGGAVPVVYASSAAVYGDNDQVPLAEDAAVRPLTAYGADKLGCELHARVASHVHGVPTRGVRFFNIYGPRQDPKSPYSGVISIFTDRIKAGRAVDIHGDGGQTRDFVFVADAVRFLLGAMAGPISGPEVFNGCTGIGTSIGELAQILMDISGNRVELRHVDTRPGDIRTSLGNPEKSGRVLGVTTQVPVAEGLKQTYASLT